MEEESYFSRVLKIWGQDLKRGACWYVKCWVTLATLIFLGFVLLGAVSAGGARGLVMFAVVLGIIVWFSTRK